MIAVPPFSQTRGRGSPWPVKASESLFGTLFHVPHSQFEQRAVQEGFFSLFQVALCFPLQQPRISMVCLAAGRFRSVRLVRGRECLRNDREPMCSGTRQTGKGYLRIRVSSSGEPAVAGSSRGTSSRGEGCSAAATGSSGGSGSGLGGALLFFRIPDSSKRRRSRTTNPFPSFSSAMTHASAKKGLPSRTGNRPGLPEVR